MGAKFAVRYVYYKYGFVVNVFQIDVIGHLGLAEEEGGVKIALLSAPAKARWSRQALPV